MNEENTMMDQSELAESVAKNVKYQFLDFFLVKPLDPIKVKKEFSKPVSTGTPTKDKNGVEAQDFDNVETEVKEVDSDYRKGVVIKLPMYYTEPVDPEHPTMRPIKVGDVVIFREAAGLRFDLLKDSRLLRQYDILGIEK
jgi:co-chaperonin GroES (HSP10)